MTNAATLKLAIVASALGNAVRQAPRRARVMGFDGLQFDAFGAGLDITQLSGTGRREFLHLLSAENQQLVGLRDDLGAKGLGPGADVERALHRLERAMQAAKALAAPLVCVDVGPLPPAPRAQRARPRVTAQEAGSIILPEGFAATPAPEATELHSIPARVDPTFGPQVESALAELGRRADRYGVTLAFRSDLASFAATEHVLKAVNCPWFGIDLDPAAVLRDEWELDEIFSRLAGMIRHVRGRDAVRGDNRRTEPASIGQGNTEWDEFLAALDSGGYRGWITLDPIELSDGLAAARDGLKHLRPTH